jgi:hypothetical protein
MFVTVYACMCTNAKVEHICPHNIYSFVPTTSHGSHLIENLYIYSLNPLFCSIALIKGVVVRQLNSYQSLINSYYLLLLLMEASTQISITLIFLFLFHSLRGDFLILIWLEIMMHVTSKMYM